MLLQPSNVFLATANLGQGPTNIPQLSKGESTSAMLCEHQPALPIIPVEAHRYSIPCRHAPSLACAIPMLVEGTNHREPEQLLVGMNTPPEYWVIIEIIQMTDNAKMFKYRVFSGTGSI